MTAEDAVRAMLAARDRDVAHCTMTEDDFEDLMRDKPNYVTVTRATGIFSELGILGYCLGITLFDSDLWRDHPLMFKQLVEAPRAIARPA